MALPVSPNTISMSQVNTELGITATATISLNDTAVRTLFGKPSGTISMSDGHGKSSEITVTFSTSTLNATVNINSLSGYSAGSAIVHIVINSGVYLWSDSSTPGLTLTGGTAGDTIDIVNNGFIMGRGGNGEAFIFNENANVPWPQTPGYDAISISRPVTINNQSGYIGGGGGAGGGTIFSGGGGGGGAGGGIGGFSSNDTSGGATAGLAGGAIGQAGGAGTIGSGHGGRIMPGSTTTGPTVTTGISTPGIGGQAGGSGGVGFLVYKSSKSAYPAGGGGGWGASGGTGYGTSSTTGGISATGGSGGGSGSAGGNGSFSGVSATESAAPTAGGKAIRTNGHAVTWVGGSASSNRSFGAVN